MNVGVGVLRIAVLCLLLLTGTAAAQEKPPIRLKMELMSIRNRSSGPLPVHIKLEYNKPQILEGDLELQIYDSRSTLEASDLIASVRYEGIVLAGGDYEFNIVLPPLKTSVTQNWAIVATFATEKGRIRLSATQNKNGNIQPFDLLTASPMERGVLLCSCFKEARRHSESKNRKFLESALSLDNYNPIYERLEKQNAVNPTEQLSGTQKLALIGRTIIHFAGQWSSKDLPQDPLSYCAFDAVLLSDEALASLQKEQLDGLTAWVRAGGSVCIVPDTPLKALHLEFLRKLMAVGVDSTADLSLDSDGRLLVVSDEVDPVLMSHCGLGRAVLLPAVEDYTTRLKQSELGEIVSFLWKVHKNQPVWKGENWIPADVVAQLKAQGINAGQDEGGVYILGQNTRQFRRQSYREKDGGYYVELGQLETQFGIHDQLKPAAEPLLGVVENALMPKDVQMVPTSVIGLILVGYVLAIGPGDYFLLGWLRMRKYTWVLFPVITGVFTLLTVVVANAFMGSEDTGGKLVITDLADNGIPVRQTVLETMYYSSQANVKKDHKNELVVLSEDNFSHLQFRNQYDNGTRSQDSPLSYSGHFPQNYSVQHLVQQWSPVTLRTLSLEPQESEVPPIDWNDATLVTTPEGNLRLKATMTEHWKRIRQNASNRVEFFMVIYHEDNVINLMGQFPRLNENDYSRVNRRYLGPGEQPFYGSETQAMLGWIPTVKASNQNVFSLVSQIAPHGAGSFEDLAFLDNSDSSQWALVIIEPRGEDFHVFRKLYVVKE